MKKIILIILLLLALLIPKNVKATYNPLEVANNKYGIHIVDEQDLDNASKLVNSNDGDWGYVVMVIQQNNRSVEKWNNIFLELKKKHLIPIIRLATNPQENFWHKAEKEEINGWIDFLNSLDWFTKNRYIVIFNEPNHAKEWGYTVDPSNYASILVEFSKKLKEKSTDFFILPAGFDASAPNSKYTMDEVLFLKQMIKSEPELFSYIDGWTSHSYPNPGFVGSSNSQGRGTIRTFKWEIALLKSLGLEKELPIFITETGWPHKEGVVNKSYFSADKVGELIEKSAYEVWSSDKIVAVCPFILNYQSIPFSNFSWQKNGSSEFYPQYEIYQSLPKVKGEPKLIIKITPTKTTEDNIKGVELEPKKESKKKAKGFISGIFQELVYRLPFLQKFLFRSI